MKESLTIVAGFWQFCEFLGVRHLGKTCCNNRLLCRGGEFAKQITAYSSCVRKWKEVKQVWHAAGRTIQSGVLSPSWAVEIRTGSATTLEPPAWHSVGLPYDTKIDHWGMDTGHSHVTRGKWSSVYEHRTTSSGYIFVCSICVHLTGCWIGLRFQTFRGWVTLFDVFSLNKYIVT